MNYPFYKKSSIAVQESLFELDSSSRNGADKSKVSKAVVHIAWLKEQNRGFCEADEAAFYLICGKFGNPTKSSEKINWKGEAVSSSMGLQAELYSEDVL